MKYRENEDLNQKMWFRNGKDSHFPWFKIRPLVYKVQLHIGNTHDQRPNNITYDIAPKSKVPYGMQPFIPYFSKIKKWALKTWVLKAFHVN